MTVWVLVKTLYKKRKTALMAVFMLRSIVFD